MSIFSNDIVMGIIVSICEIILLVAFFAFLNFLVRIVVRRIEGMAFVAKSKDRVETIRRNITGLLWFMCGLLCLALLGFNGYLFYRQENILRYTIALVRGIPREVWLHFAFGILKLIGLVIVVTISLRGIRKALGKYCDKAKAYENIKANDESIDVFFSALDNIITNSLWLLVFAFMTTVMPFPALVPAYLYIFLRVYLIVSIGRLLVSAIDVVVKSLDALSRKYSSPDNILRFYDQFSGLVPVFRRCLEYVIYVGVATLVVLQLDFISRFAVYGPLAIQVIGIFFMTRVVIEISNFFFDRMLTSTPKEGELSELERQKRNTLRPLVKSFAKYAIFFVSFVVVLRVLGINPTPILAGAGIASIVVGLGAQPLLNDLVSGFFIILENLYLVGDCIETGSARGIVEGVDIRTTRVRALGGQLHILRNGQLGDVINYSKTYVCAVVDVGVSYDSDLDHVYRVIAEVGEQCMESHPDVLEPTKVLGLQDFGDSELLIRTLTRVKPGKHAQTERDLRKLIKEAFDRENIEIPFPQRVLTHKGGTLEPEAPPQLALLATDMDGTIIPYPGGLDCTPDIRAFKRALRHTDNLKLIYATGRSHEQALSAVLQHDLPRPDFMICDAGTSIYEWDNDWYPDLDYRKELRARLDEHTAEDVRRALEPLSCLSLQEPGKQGEFKVSYYVSDMDEPDELTALVKEALDAKGIGSFQVLVSLDVENRHGLLDVLPRGVAKDTAVRYLAERLSVPPGQVVYAGDSGNDLNAFLTEFRAILVANTEEWVKERVRQQASTENPERVYYAEEPCTAGVIEGARHFGIFT